MRDKNGEPVANPLNWVFSSLARTGYYRRPQGYISLQEQAEIDAAKEYERLKKAREIHKKSAFEAWRSGLSPEEKNAIAEPENRAFPMPEDTALRQHFFHKVWPDILKQGSPSTAEKQGRNMTEAQENPSASSFPVSAGRMGAVIRLHPARGISLWTPVPLGAALLAAKTQKALS